MTTAQRRKERIATETTDERIARLTRERDFAVLVARLAAARISDGRAGSGYQMRPTRNRPASGSSNLCPPQRGHTSPFRRSRPISLCGSAFCTRRTTDAHPSRSPQGKACRLALTGEAIEAWLCGASSTPDQAFGLQPAQSCRDGGPAQPARFGEDGLGWPRAEAGHEPVAQGEQHQMFTGARR